MVAKPEQDLSREPRGALPVSGLDLEKKIFSASGRGGAFFLTSLFIELIDDWVVSVIEVTTFIFG
jgi:hypothetical protein